MASEDHMNAPNPEPHNDEARDLDRGQPAAIRHLKEALNSGQDWYRALLEAMGMWSAPEEEFQGRRYQYVLLGEAFDWLLLAERLCAELDGMVPAEEKELLLFEGRLPGKVTPQEFRQLIGHGKHRGFLNYWYGVVVEEALQLAVEEEVRKQHRARGFPDSEDLVERAFDRIYEDTRANLLREFLRERKRSGRVSVGLTDMKEFTYWLFKRRVDMWDPARVASDTRKGLERLQKLRPNDTFLGA